MQNLIGLILVLKDPQIGEITADQVREKFGAKATDFTKVVLAPEGSSLNKIDLSQTEAVIFWDIDTKKITQIKENNFA